MKKFIKTYSYGIYLPIALTCFVGISIANWQWWAIVVPMIILVNWKAD